MIDETDAIEDYTFKNKPNKYWDFETEDDFRKALAFLRVEDIEETVEHERQHLEAAKKLGFKPTYRIAFWDNRIYNLPEGKVHISRVICPGTFTPFFSIRPTKEELAKIISAPSEPSNGDIRQLKEVETKRVSTVLKQVS